MVSEMHGCLFLVITRLFDIETTDPCREICDFRRSRFMLSIISFELDEDCILPYLVNDDDLFFPQSSHLTHIRVTLRHFDDCILLLTQLGSQLHSFAVSLVFTHLRRHSNIIPLLIPVNICFQFSISIN